MIEFKLHESCEGCMAYLPDNPDLPCCDLGIPIDMIEPLEQCYKPETEKILTVIKTLWRNPYGKN